MDKKRRQTRETEESKEVKEDKCCREKVKLGERGKEKQKESHAEMEGSKGCTKRRGRQTRG